MSYANSFQVRYNKQQRTISEGTQIHALACWLKLLPPSNQRVGTTATFRNNIRNSQESHHNIPLFCSWVGSGRWAHGIGIFNESLSINVFPRVDFWKRVKFRTWPSNVPKVEDDTRKTEAAPQATQKTKKSKPFMFYEKKKLIRLPISASKLEIKEPLFSFGRISLKNISVNTSLSWKERVKY